MTQNKKNNKIARFKEFFIKVEPIKVEEPLGKTLGAFEDDGSILEYSYIDVIKMAGHACPTTAGAYLCCKKALEALYPDEIPTRGEINIVINGESDEGVYGVIGQVFSYITGAATESGFKGLGPKFKRKNLLTYSTGKIDPEAMSFTFSRLDKKRSVLVKFYPHKVPSPIDIEKRKKELLEKVIWEAAKEEEIKEFQRLWIKKVENMLLEKDINRWLIVQEGRI